MKNANRLFGRKLSKLILTPIISLGLVAGFAVSPARANFDPDLSPNAGEVAVVQTGNAIDGLTLSWSAWLPTAPSFDNPSSPEATFGARAVPFAIVACADSSVVITDCIGGYFVYNEVARSNFVGFLRDNAMVTGHNGVNSITITKAGSTTLRWSPDATGVDNDTNPTSVQFLTPNAYKLYVYIAIPVTDLSNNNQGARTSNANPYYASAPISVDFRDPSATPTITTQPTGGAKTAGDALSLSVTATRTGSGTLSYQWKKGGTAISGATSATLSIPSVATSDAGSYTVDVTNQVTGNAPVTVASNAAVVTVAAATTPSTTVGSTLNTKTAKAGGIAFSAGASSLSSATKSSIKATVKEAGKSAKYTITGTAGKKSGVSDKAVKALAKKRANILKAYLVKLGVPKSSITIKTKVVKQGKKPKASVLALY
jgi:outer membrane protein OmpA-like peptidoglycan-associated protein